MKQFILKKFITSYNIPEFGYKSTSKSDDYHVNLHINDSYSDINGRLYLSKDSLYFSTISNNYFSFIDLHSEQSFYLSLEFESSIDPIVIKTNVFNYNNPSNKVKIKLLNGTLDYDYLTDTITSKPNSEDVSVDYFIFSSNIKVYDSIYW